RPTKRNEELWKQFMSFQGPAMQSLISAYMEQSRNVFQQMQEQLQNQTRSMFSGFPFPGFHGVPGFGAQPAGAQPSPGDNKTAGEEKKSTRLNSSHEWISYAVFCLKKKKEKIPENVMQPIQE